MFAHLNQNQGNFGNPYQYNAQHSPTVPVPSSTVVGEGSYGCVHTPSLSCIDATKNDQANAVFHNPVSKLMTSGEAEKETSEYNIIDSIDPSQNHYLGKPIKCKVDDNNMSNMQSAAKCKHLLENNPSLVNDMRNYSLLLMENGGNNLIDFSEELVTSPSMGGADKKIELELFWIAFHSIFMGLKLFDSNNVVHHDTKGENLVYDATTHKVKFIDFGLMTTYDKIISGARRNSRSYTKAHWSYPLEVAFYGIDNFNTVHAPSNKTPEVHLNDILSNKTYDLINCIDAITTIVDEANPNIYIDKFANGFNRTLCYIKTTSHDDFLRKSMKTLDTYGVGVGMFDVLYITANLMDDPLAHALLNIAHGLCDSNLQTRLNVDTVLPLYEQCLVDSGLLRKHNLHFEHNVLVNGITNIMKITNEISNNVRLSKSKIKSSSSSKNSRTTRKKPIRSPKPRKAKTTKKYYK